MKTWKQFLCILLCLTLGLACGAVLPGAAEDSAASPVCIPAEEWTALFDRRGQTETWLGGDGIYSVALDGNDALGSATEGTKTFFIFSDSLMGSADAEGNVYWAPGQPSQTSAVLTGNTPDPENMAFVWGPGGNGAFGWDTHLFGEHKWMFDCFVEGDAVYIFGFPEDSWRPARIDMVKIPVADGAPDYANYSITYGISQLYYLDAGNFDDSKYLYAYGMAVLSNTVSAGAPDPDGYIYIYGYRGTLHEFFNTNSLIVSRIKEEDFPDFSKLTYWDGEGWGTDIAASAPLVNGVSCESSVTPITTGPAAGKYLTVYTQNTESSDLMYAVGDSPVGPFDKPVCFYKTPEYGGDNGGIYTYNAKAHPHLSSDGRLLVSYNCNNRNAFGNQTTVDYHPRFVWLDLNSVTVDDSWKENVARSKNGDVTITASCDTREGSALSYLNDGNDDTCWETPDTAGGTLTVTWDSPKTIDRIHLIWGLGRTQDEQRYDAIAYSPDGETWLPLDCTAADREEYQTFFYRDAITVNGDPVTVKALRITFSACAAFWYQLRELEVYGTAVAEIPLAGDLNRDGSLSVTDVVLLRKEILSGGFDSVGDLSGDNLLSVSDVVLLRKAILKG